MKEDLTPYSGSAHLGYDDLRRPLILIASASIIIIAIATNIISLVIGSETSLPFPPFTVLLAIPALVSYFLATRWRLDLAAPILCGGCTAVFFLLFLLVTQVPTGISISVLALLLLLVGFLSGPKSSLALGAFDVFILLVLSIISEVQNNSPQISHLLTSIGVLSMFTLATYAVAKNMLDLRENLRRKFMELENFVPKLITTGGQIAVDARQVHVMADQQREGAARQAISLGDTRNTMHKIHEASREIAESAHAVYTSIERTSTNNERVALQVAELSSRALQVGKIADGIKEIAGKSELLALNASLQGVKAGHAGEGFLIVADKMQRLSESITDLSRQIKKLTREIQRASDETRQSAEEALELARETTIISKKISVVTVQQQQGTELVALSLDDIAEVIQELVTSSENAINTTYSLLEVAENLPILLSEVGAIEFVDHANGFRDIYSKTGELIVSSSDVRELARHLDQQ